MNTFVRFRDTSSAVKKSGIHSRRVSRLKRFLPILAVFALAYLILWPLWKAPKIADVFSGGSPGLIIENLHYTGLDNKAQPYSISALRAVQVDSRQKLVDLEKPEAEITLDTGAWISTRAHRGQYNQELKKLSLSENVELFHDNGNQLLAQDLHVNLSEHEILSQKPVTILGTFGQIKGQGIFVGNKDKIVIIQGPAKMLLKVKP